MVRCAFIRVQAYAYIGWYYWASLVDNASVTEDVERFVLPYS